MAVSILATDGGSKKGNLREHIGNVYSGQNTGVYTYFHKLQHII